MKSFTFIFSIYLLVLSCVPCADKNECNINTAITTVIVVSHNQHKHQTDDEACTPFCTCSCCAASAFFQLVSSYQILKKDFFSVEYSPYKVSHASQVLFAIWQPPKLNDAIIK